MLVGKFSRLRRLESADSEYVRQLRNSPPVANNFLDRNFITDIQQERWVESISLDNTDLYFVAEEIDENRPFGVYHLKHIDHRNQRAEFGLFLDEHGRGRGEIAFEAAYLLFNYGFGYLNLHKIYGEVLSENSRAIRFDKGLGMQLESTLRQHAFYDAQFHDVLIYTIFRDDFYRQPTEFVRLYRASGD